MSKATNYTILLICEGIHTEPNFFSGMWVWVKDTFGPAYELKIHPTPTIDEDIDTVPAEIRGTSPRKTKKTNNFTPEQQELEVPTFFPGEQPLNWVKGGVENLKVYDEVWVVFDKDGHPKAPDAFKLAKETKDNGGNLHIAFTSRCFEYFLLLHFERIYRAFEKSECNEKVPVRKNGKEISSKTRSFHCMTKDAVVGKACQGDKCINGYARLKGYWQESKDGSSTFRLVKDKLGKGLVNSQYVRRHSELMNPGTEIYDRNPYVDVDILVWRLMGFTLIESGWSYEANDGKITLTLSRSANNLTITLITGQHCILTSFHSDIVNSITGQRRKSGWRINLDTSSPQVSVNITEALGKDEIMEVRIGNFYGILIPYEE